MTPGAATSIGLDPAEPAFRADPHAVYRAMSERAPVARLPGEGPWAVTGYEHVRALLRDPRIRVRSQELPAPGASTEQPHLRARRHAERLFGAFMTDRAEADHARLRRLVMPAFSRTNVAARRTRIQAFTDERVDQALSRGRMDVVGDLGRPLAMTVITELMGIPEAMRPEVERWARDLVHRVEVDPTTVERERSLLAMVGLTGRLRELIAARGEDGLLGTLAQARAEGALSEEEVVAHGAILLLVGHITTQHLIGNGVLALLRHPDQWQLLRERPDLIETAVDELLRYDTSAPVVPCAASEDIEIAGETIRRGESILVLIAAAHRDPAVFADPDRLDITRSPNPHLGFGHGAHRCVGAALASLEAQVAIGTLVRRLPSPRLESEQPVWEETFVVRGLKSLPILVGD